ncbi:MAG: hypothetical protein MZW92_71140 [Comamonadaceae bacterium]|nr:hypothetical protein [Comamonadaceae bacterium]
MNIAYVFCGLDGKSHHEPEFRQVEATGATQMVLDQWFSPEWPVAAYLRQAFAGVIFQPRPDGARRKDGIIGPPPPGSPCTPRVFPATIAYASPGVIRA